MTTMSIQYTNRLGQIYYLCQGITKTGKPKYFFSTKTDGNRVKMIPDDFEIYENPNAQVFLIKKGDGSKPVNTHPVFCSYF